MLGIDPYCGEKISLKSAKPIRDGEAAKKQGTLIHNHTREGSSPFLVVSIQSRRRFDEVRVEFEESGAGLQRKRKRRGRGRGRRKGVMKE